MLSMLVGPTAGLVRPNTSCLLFRSTMSRQRLGMD